MLCSCSGNRAECALRLGDFEKALADAQTSLDLDKTNAKSQARKTRAQEAIAEAAAEKEAADKKRAALVSPTTGDCFVQCSRQLALVWLLPFGRVSVPTKLSW